MAKIIKSMKNLIEKGGEKEMKKLALLVICLGVVLYVLPAYALPTYNICDIHKFKYEDYENWIDSTAPYGMISPGDQMYGILRINTIVDTITGDTMWRDVANPDGAELTGYFDFLVANVTFQPAANKYKVDFTGNLDAYYDTTPNWNAAAADAIARATDGALYLSTTIGFPQNAANGYWYGIGEIAPGALGWPETVARMYGGFNLSVNNTGYSWLNIDDPNENIVPGQPVLVDFFVNGNLYGTDTSGWTFRSEDPVYGHPTPEPASLLLLGTGLLGIATLGMRKKRSIA